HSDDCEVGQRRRTRNYPLSLHDALPILLSVPGFAPEPAGALKSLRARIRTEEAARPPRWYERWLNQASPRWRPMATPAVAVLLRSEEHTSELQSLAYLVCRLLLEKKNIS